MRATVDGRTIEVTRAQFAGILQDKLRYLEWQIGALAERSRSYEHYRSGRGQRTAGRGISAPADDRRGLGQEVLESFHTAVSYVSDIAAGTWQPNVEELTREPRRHLQDASVALYSDTGLVPSVHDRDWERSIRHMQRCEQLINDGNSQWNRYLQETQSGAMRAAEVLTVVRDLSFVIVSTIATGGAATVAEGMVAGAVVAGVEESATQIGEGLVDPRQGLDYGRLGTALVAGGVSGGIGAAVRPVAGGLPTRIIRGAVAGGLTNATEETVRQTGETATGRRHQADWARIGTAGVIGSAVGGGVGAVHGASDASPSAREASATATEAPTSGPSEATPRPLGERTAIPPPAPSLRQISERTAVPPPEPGTFMRPIGPGSDANVAGRGARWPGFDPDLRLAEVSNIRPLVEEEARVARRLIDAGIDARYEVVPTDQYVRRFRRGAGREAPIPAGFVDRDGKVFLPEGEVGAAGPSSAAPASPTTGAAGDVAGGPVRQPPPPRVIEGEPASPGGARAAEGSPVAHGPGGSPSAAMIRATSFREIGDNEAQALAQAFEAGLVAPPDRTTFPRPEMYEEEFRALFGPDVPLPVHGYVTNTGYRVVAPSSEAGTLFWH